MMSKQLRIEFISGDGWAADYAIIDWGEPWHGQRVRVVNGVNPRHTAEAQAESLRIAGWICGREDTPVAVAELYNTLLDDNEAAARAKYPDFEFEPAPRVRGIAYLKADRQPVWQPEYVPGIWHWEFRPLQEACDV